MALESNQNATTFKGHVNLPAMVEVHQLEIGPTQNFVYVLEDTSLEPRPCWIVDPQPDLAPLEALASERNMRFEGILLTHTHPDHTGGVAPLLLKYPSIAFVALNATEFARLGERLKRELASLEKPAIQNLLNCLEEVPDGWARKLGSVEVRAYHTPGHTPGGTCYLVGQKLLTGDTLFIGNCGRTDLPGGDSAKMFESLQKLKTFPKNTEILPGHHYVEASTSTIAKEWASNPTFKANSVSELDAIP